MTGKNRQDEGNVSKLDRAFYDRDALTVARGLIGTRLVRKHGRQRFAGRIVETEAYQGPEDLAAHSARGRRTTRTEVMFGPPGHAYVYLIYGMWNCFNIVVREAGIPHAVLVRALAPERSEHRTWGPGLLCHAFEIDRTLSGADLRSDTIWIERPERAVPANIATAPRIGVDYAGDWAKKPWRFFDADSPFVSTLSAAERGKRLREITSRGAPRDGGG